ncbi:MAG TPA: PilT/PilU family type 4a pilus ATPase [Verrucomicrobiae bacterium]|nr:PilT/PilU family type 4a pilus ATPase [Verrucomicrobiae bacterium]
MSKSLSILPGIIKEAVSQNAADIILSEGCFPVLKVGSSLKKLNDFGELSDDAIHGVVSDILPSAKLKTLEDDRQVDLAYAQGDARFRVNVFYQRGHLTVVMRYVKNKILSLEELGLPSLLKELVENDNGLILMVGPTGSGKSTSLAAMIDHINGNFEKHIITIEDPIEYVYDNKQSVIEQREVGVDAVSFSSALRSALREAPDVILLGEMRDLESVSTAVTVAETGHLVLSTIHANSAPGTIDRIIDIFPPEQKEQIRIQLADILVAVLNQRLIPRADGVGMTVALEVMIANSAVKNAVRTGNTAQLPTIMQTGAADGMVLLDDILIKAAKHGEITKESALAYANDRDEVRKGLSAV